MARAAGIGDPIGFSIGWRDKAKRMTADIHVRDGPCNLRHMAVDAFDFLNTMLSVLCECARGPGYRFRPVAGEAESIARLDQVSGIVRAVYIVTSPASDPSLVHITRDVLVPLHSVFVGGPFRPVGERLFAQVMFLEHPVFIEAVARLVADRPIVVNAVQRILSGLALRMALDTDVDTAHVVEARGVDDVIFYGILDMWLTRSMAFFTTDIPFGHLLRRDVIVR